MGYNWYTNSKSPDLAFIVGHRGKILCTGPRFTIMCLCWDLNWEEMFDPDDEYYLDDDHGLEPPA